MNDTESNDQGLPLRIFRCEESAEYAKRVMAYQDIQFSIRCLIKLRELNKRDKEEGLVKEALWNSAIIRAYSIFDGNRSIKLEILDKLPEGAREAYNYFRNYRRTHIAHRVNPVDQVKAGVILSDPNSSKKEVLGVGNLAIEDASYSDSEFVDSLGRFLDVLKKQIEIETKEWEEKMLIKANNEDIEELYKLKTLRVVVPSGVHLHKGT